MGTVHPYLRQNKKKYLQSIVLLAWVEINIKKYIKILKYYIINTLKSKKIEPNLFYAQVSIRLWFKWFKILFGLNLSKYLGEVWIYQSS